MRSDLRGRQTISYEHLVFRGPLSFGAIVQVFLKMEAWSPVIQMVWDIYRTMIHGCEIDLQSGCPRPIHLSKPGLFRCQLFCEALPHPSAPCLYTFQILLCVLHALKLFLVCLFVLLDCRDNVL